MKKLLFILPFIVLLSCSVQKRKYQKGFYVSNLKHKKHDQTNTATTSNKEIQVERLVLKPFPIQKDLNEVDVLSASAGNDIHLFPSLISKQKKSNPDSLCDKIILRNGDESMVKILEITPNDVKYKKCDSPDGPLYVVKKADVFMITFANGTKEVFKTENTTIQNNSNSSIQQNKNYDRPRRTHPLAILALVFAIIGLFTYGLFSIFSIICATSAERRIRANPQVYKGAKLAKVSRIASIVVLSIIAASLLFSLILLLLFL